MLWRLQAVLAANNIGCGNFVHGFVCQPPPHNNTHATLIKAINMFVYKENTITSGIRRRGISRSDSLQLEGDKETSDIKGHLHTPTTSSANKTKLQSGFPTFDVKIIAGKRVVIYHDQLPENKTR